MSQFIHHSGANPQSDEPISKVSKKPLDVFWETHPIDDTDDSILRAYEMLLSEDVLELPAPAGPLDKRLAGEHKDNQ